MPLMAWLTICLLCPQPPQFVTLVSSDGYEFVVSRKCVIGAGTIKSMLNGPGLWQTGG